MSMNYEVKIPAIPSLDREIAKWEKVAVKLNQAMEKQYDLYKKAKRADERAEFENQPRPKDVPFYGDLYKKFEQIGDRKYAVVSLIKELHKLAGIEFDARVKPY